MKESCIIPKGNEPENDTVNPLMITGQSVTRVTKEITPATPAPPKDFLLMLPSKE
jgi:hypothetical protein